MGRAIAKASLDMNWVLQDACCGSCTLASHSFQRMPHLLKCSKALLPSLARHQLEHRLFMPHHGTYMASLLGLSYSRAKPTPPCNR